MARSRLFLTPEDHDYFLRIFPEARAMAWDHVPERGCWRVEFDPESPTPAETAALGESLGVCLDRLGRLGHPEPPDLGDEGEGFPPNANAPGGKRPGRSRVRPYFLLLLLLTAVGSGVALFFSGEPEAPDIAPVVPAMPDRDDPAEIAASDDAGNEYVLEGEIIVMLDRCRRLLDEGDLTTGAAGTALECYRKVLARVPGNLEARNGLRRIEQHFIARAETALKRGEAGDARGFLETLESVNPDSVHLGRLRGELERLERRLARPPVAPEASRPAVSAPAPRTRRPEPRSASSPPSTEQQRPMDTDALIRESLGTGFQPGEP
jgi:hypothetical protein